jgi:hypothetical protein
MLSASGEVAPDKRIVAIAVARRQAAGTIKAIAGRGS